MICGWQIFMRLKTLPVLAPSRGGVKPPVQLVVLIVREFAQRIYAIIRYSSIFAQRSRLCIVICSNLPWQAKPPVHRFGVGRPM